MPRPRSSPASSAQAQRLRGTADYGPYKDVLTKERMMKRGGLVYNGYVPDVRAIATILQQDHQRMLTMEERIATLEQQRGRPPVR
jgi:hypothetical protein